MYRTMVRLVLLSIGCIATAVHADVISVTVTGDVAAIQRAGTGNSEELTGVPLGTPYTWTATYDSSIIHGRHQSQALLGKYGSAIQ